MDFFINWKNVFKLITYISLHFNLNKKKNSSFSVKNKYETDYILSNSVSFYHLDV